MGPEPRSRADQGQPGANPQGEEPRARPEPKVKSFEIDKRLIVEAWEKVRANNGAPGVEIPKDHGEGVRLLGVPNTADRVAQTAAAMLLEEKLEPVFHRDSYGYRPGRSAHDALAVCRRRCWTRDWVLDLDVRAFFDSVPHSLLLKAVAHHTSERWVLLYISRWLKAPMQMPDGTIVPREKGTRRVPRFRRCWLICSCIMRSTRGWTGNSRAARLSATRMTLSRTAAARSRPGCCGPLSPRGSGRWVLSCIP